MRELVEEFEDIAAALPGAVEPEEPPKRRPRRKRSPDLTDVTDVTRCGGGPAETVWGVPVEPEDRQLDLEDAEEQAVECTPHGNRITPVRCACRNPCCADC